MPGVSSPPVLDVRELSVSRGPRRVLDRLVFQVHAGRTLALLGESGAGKTTCALAVLGLLPAGAHVVGGQVLLGGTDLLNLDSHARRAVLGQRVGAVFQDPASALHPALTVGEQVAEVLRQHAGQGRRQAWADAVAWLDRLHLLEPHRRAREYPHQLSGGMRQRVLLAMGLAARPELLVADEPTTSLDGPHRAHVFRVLREEQQSRGLGVLLITHDVRDLPGVAQDVVVLLDGQVVEAGPAAAVASAPRHPYTRQCVAAYSLAAVPTEMSTPLMSTEHATGPACAFRSRCPRAHPRCSQEEPRLEEGTPGHSVRCFFPCPPPEGP